MRKRLLLVTIALALLVSACKQKVSPAEAAEHLKAAQDLYAAKDYSKALVEVQTAIKANPLSGEGYFLAAQIEEALGDQNGAVENYARAASPNLNNLKAQLRFEEILIDARQLDAAVGRINGTLGSHPNDPDALALRAMAYQRQGNAEKARTDAQAALALSPGQTNATAVLAADALVQKNSGKALTLLASGLKISPNAVPLLRLKAAAMLQQDNSDGAVGIYQELVQGHPNDVNSRASLAEIDASSGQVDAGEKVLRDGVAAQPTSRELRIALIAFLIKHRGEAAGDAEMQSAINDNPQDSAYDLMRADQQLRTGHPDDAAKTLQGAIARVPQGPARETAQIALARLELAQGQAENARKLLDEVLAAKADNDDALLMRAGMMVADGDTAHAVPDLLAVASRRPRSPAPLLLLADAYSRQSDPDKAIDALKKALYFDPTDLQPVMSLAKLQLQQKLPDDAKRTIAEFVRRNPEALDGYIAEVRLALEQKDFPGAQAGIDAMRRVPKADRAVAFLGAELSEAKGDTAAALAAYARMIDPDKPFDREALVGYARIAASTKDPGKAIPVVAALASRKTGVDAADADIILAALYRSAAQTDKADEALKAAMAAAPTQPAPYLEAARAAAPTHPEAAIKVINAGIAAGAPQAPLLMARAEFEDALGQTDAAIETYKTVIKLDPKSVVAANNYASLIADAKPADKAMLANAREPIQRFAAGANPAVLDTLAWLDYRLGDFQSAKALLTRAKADTSKNPQLRFHYGAVLIALGDKDAGRTVLKNAIGETFPGRDEAERMLTQ